MNPAPALARALPRALVAAAAVVGIGATASAAYAQGAPDVDRTDDASIDISARTDRAQDRLRRKLGDGALISNDRVTGTPRIVARLDGFLTGPSDEDSLTIALDYVRDHLDAFGLDTGDLATLRLTSTERNVDGTVHLSWEQRAGGVPNVDGGLEAAVTADGRLLNVRGGAIPDPASHPPEPHVSASTAYATALPGAAPAPRSTDAHGTVREREFADGGSASLVRYMDEGADRLGWRLLVPASSDAFYDAIVDARTGVLQRRINRVRFAVNHFDVNPRAEGGSWDNDPTPSAWLPAGAMTLSGPYAHAVSDLDDSIKLQDDEPPYPLTQEPVPADDDVDPTAPEWPYEPTFFGSCGFCSWSDSDRTANREFSTAQLFWYVNTFHDHLAQPPIRFTDANGGFENEDPVLAQSLDGALTEDPDVNLDLPDPEHRNNASMLTLPDGYRGLMQVHLFARGSTRRYDGAHDAALVYHEYTHGLTDRLVTDAHGWAAMFGRQPDALAEGISDFYAMDFLVESQPGIVPDNQNTPGEVHFAKWLQSSPSTKGRTGTLRTQGLDCRVDEPDTDACPGTEDTGPGGYRYDDFGKVQDGPEEHADGEIWAQTLWDLRTELGVDKTREYVTAGLPLVPDNPTFLDMRNAIVQAAVNSSSDEDWVAIWQVFAERGMGWSAATEGPHDVAPSAATDVPPLPGDTSGRGSVEGTVTDETGQPVSGARVAVAGHDSDVGSTDLRAITGADGRYVMTAIPAEFYPDFYVHKPGYQERSVGLTVTGGSTEPVDFRGLRRDYASTASGGSADSDPDFEDCGATQAIDDDKKTVWSMPAEEGPQDLLIDLGRQIDVFEVRIDPRPGCGDGPEASLSQYELYASSTGEQFQQIAAGTLGTVDARGYVSVPLDTSALAGRRYVRLRAIAPRSLEQGEGGAFMDVSEIEVTGTPTPPPPPPPPDNPPPTNPPPTNPPPSNPPPTNPPVVRPTLLLDTKLSARRKGTFKVRAFFGDAAPAGDARFTIIGPKRTQYARATTPVRVGGNVVKTLKLKKKALRAIKPGKSKRVTLELRLPNGQKITTTLRLARSKR